MKKVKKMYKINFKDRIFEQDGSIKTTRVQIQEDMTVITRVLKGDIYSLDDETLIKLVLEQFYQDTFPNRAENEKFEKMDSKLALVDEKLAELDKFKKELDITQGSLMDLITQIGGSLEADKHEETTTSEIKIEGGDSNDGNAIRD